MPVRATTADLRALVRQMINDLGTTPQFTDQQVQDRLDAHRSDVWYEELEAVPAIVNAASTNNQAQFVFADFYSRYQWWETDVTLQGVSNNDFRKVLTPVTSDYITGHWQFQSNVFVSGVAPGQWPPVYISGKIFDCYGASADLLEFWAAKLVLKFDVDVGGQVFKRSQAVDMLQKLACSYRQKQKPKTVKMTRSDTVRSR